MLLHRRGAALHAIGFAILISPLALPAGAQWTNCTHGQATCSSSSVGIGTTATPARLTVSGSGSYGAGGAAQFNLSNSVWGNAFVQHLGDTGLWQLADGSTGSTKLTVAPTANGDVNFYSGTGKTIFNGTGFVGLGTTTPRAKLDTFVASPATSTISTIAAFNGGLSRISVNSGTLSDKTGFWASFYNGETITGGVAGGMTVGRYGSAWGTYVGFHTHPDDTVTPDDQPERMRIDGRGWVGIGRIAPRALFDTWMQTPVTGAITKIGDFNGALNRISVNSAALTDKTGYWANFYGSGDGLAAGMTIGRYGTGWGTYVAFHTHPEATDTADTSPEAMRIDGRGWVGIGVTVPEAQLHVNGTIKATSVIGATYQDLAEWVPSSVDLQPGEVVVVDRGRDNHVLASSKAYDTAVAGVVSYQPGILLGVEGAKKETIATTGRVKVRASAINGPIVAGDLLVTSDKPGTAMKSKAIDVAGMKLHRPGTLIGKALEALPNGEGEILVLLSLQ